MGKQSILFAIAAMLLLTPVVRAEEDPSARFMNMSPEELRAAEQEIITQASIRQDRYSKRIADLALIPPELDTSPSLKKYGYDVLDYAMTIGIERTPKGRLWVCWVSGGDSPDAFFLLATSDDNGETWSNPRLVIDPHSETLPMARSVIIGNLWTDPLGRLWLFFDQAMMQHDGRSGVWYSICENPDAGQPTWSKPKRIWHGAVLNKPTVLSTGEWMLPIALNQFHGRNIFHDAFDDLDPERGVNLFVSKDQGKTWQRRGLVKYPKPSWAEPMVVERRDGTLWMLARTNQGIMETTSKDVGWTWTEPVPSAIKHPSARFFIRRLASGRLLLIKHGETIDHHENRKQLTAWLSDDDGKTWKGGLMLDPRDWVTYPDGFQAPDGTITISWDRERGGAAEILMARFTEEDVLAKKLVTPGSKTQMKIVRFGDNPKRKKKLNSTD